MRRLRRPTGPNRAAMRAVSYIEDKAAAELASLEVAPAETISCDLDSDCDIEVD